VFAMWEQVIYDRITQSLEHNNEHQKENLLKFYEDGILSID